MSKAFDRAMDEVARIWQTADHFDGAALQFVGIVAAGALAAAAIVADKTPPPIPPPWFWISVGLVIIGILALVVFLILAIASTLVGVNFAGPLDPRRFPAELLKDDESFEASGLAGIQEAFDQSLQGYERKRATFRRSLVALLLAVIAFGGAGIISVTALALKGAQTMATDTPNTTPSTPAPTPAPPAPQAPSTTPSLGPYTITKGGQGAKTPAKSDSGR